MSRSIATGFLYSAPAFAPLIVRESSPPPPPKPRLLDRVREAVLIELGHFTEKRGWNEAGLAPTYQAVVTATVIPSGTPTLVFAEQGGVRQPVWHLPMSIAPHVYVYLKHFQPGLLGS